MDNVVAEILFDFQPYGEAIRQARDEKGWSREKLSEESGVSVRYLQKIENGMQAPSLKRFVSIAKSLEISIDEIVYNNDPEKPPKKSAVRHQVESLMDSMSDEDLHILMTGLMVLKINKVKRSPP